MNVSVIVPVYNVAHYIDKCIKSVIRQTYKGSMECLIIDDCGTDNSIGIAKKIISTYKGPVKFQILYHNRNRGLSAARNTGVEHALGDYIYFMDSDDEISDNCIETLAGIATKVPDADMVIGNYKCVPRNKNNTIALDMRLPEEMIYHEEIAQAFLSHRIPMNAWNKLIKRSFILEHQLLFNEGKVFEDVHWSFYMTKYLNNIRIYKGVTYYYHMRPSSIVNTTDSWNTGNSFKVIYEDILQQLTEGWEAKELNCYVEGFCKRYLQYRTIIPEYENLYKVYSSKAQDFGCKEVLLKLRLAYMMGKVPFGLGILGMMKSAKTGVTKIKREFN